MDNDNFDVFEDPFALNVMPPEELTFQDWANINSAIAMIIQATKMPEFSQVEGAFKGIKDLEDTSRRVKVLMADAGAKDPMAMIDYLRAALSK